MSNPFYPSSYDSRSDAYDPPSPPIEEENSPERKPEIVGSQSDCNPSTKINYSAKPKNKVLAKMGQVFAVVFVIVFFLYCLVFGWIK